MIATTAREALRHGMHLSGLDELLMRRRRARGQDVGHLAVPDRAGVFSYIYDRGVWRNGKDSGVLSGLGSEIEATSGLRGDLGRTLASLGASSILDIGCGDFTWMQHVDLGSMHYTGVDIVQSVVDENRRVHGSGEREFRRVDAVTDDVPRADVVLCREVLFHLSFSDGLRLLANIRRSGAEHVLLTSDRSTGFNADIATGDYRVLNLQKRPYRLPSPTAWLPDDEVLPGRGLGLWRL